MAQTDRSAVLTRSGSEAPFTAALRSGAVALFADDRGTYLVASAALVDVASVSFMIRHGSGILSVG